MSDPWVKFYPSDWLAGTRGLTMAEAGLYITLVAMMYERGAPIDMEYGRLARLCGAAPGGFKKALQGLIDQGKLIETEQGLWSKRVQNELKKRALKRDQASESARIRWEKAQQKQAPPDADASKTQCERDATRNQIPDNPHTPVKRGRASGYSDRFEAWWKSYPRKQNASKAKASKSFERLSEADKQSAEQALPAFKRSVAGTEERYVCHPTTWLNERRFETVEGSAADDDEWTARLEAWGRDGTWLRAWGPKPGRPGCKAPPDLIAKCEGRAA